MSKTAKVFFVVIGLWMLWHVGAAYTRYVRSSAQNQVLTTVNYDLLNSGHAYGYRITESGAVARVYRKPSFHSIQVKADRWETTHGQQAY